jgi:hypothetical protein
MNSFSENVEEVLVKHQVYNPDLINLNYNVIQRFYKEALKRVEMESVRQEFNSRELAPFFNHSSPIARFLAHGLLKNLFPSLSQCASEDLLEDLTFMFVQFIEKEGYILLSRTNWRERKRRIGLSASPEITNDF